MSMAEGFGGGMVGGIIGLYILRNLASNEDGEISRKDQEHGGMADEDPTVDLSDPENPYQEEEGFWWEYDDSKPIVGVGKNGTCPIGYKKVVWSKGAKCLPIK